MSSGRRFLLTPLREGRHSFPVSRYSPFAISTHAPAGGATRPRWKLARSRSTFLLTPLREGRRDPPHIPTARGCNFYSRPCGRGDDRRCRLRHLGRTISTHAPAGGATATVTELNNHKNISTHAPAGGATLTRTSPSLKQRISTHAPAGGATMLLLSRPRRITYFYSRPCGRGDQDHRGKGGRRYSISTHAPAGGATKPAVIPRA